MKRKSQQGVALVVTLILLSIITFLAVAFLALSRRERGAVTTTTEQTLSRLAANAALERAKAQVIARMLAQTNKWAFGLEVSTNYINPAGFQPGLADFTNVSYTLANGSPVLPGTANFAQNVANLLYDPRPPVFVKTNDNQVTPAEFRYYLDLNRNGRFETNGWTPVLDDLGRAMLDQNNQPVTNYFVGDPEWVGDLTRLGLPHSATNRFADRWAYLIVPIGKTLDVNYIHNQAKQLGARAEGYCRNQGLSSAELNLAAFLRDLNTNVYAWGDPSSLSSYNFNANPIGGSNGKTFGDALALLRYRYAGDYNTLLSANQYFGPRVGLIFPYDFIDEYANGPLMLGPDLVLTNDVTSDVVTAPWLGSDNTNHYYTPQEFFDPAKVTAAFTNHLYAPGTNNSSYNRYTYYRLLSAMGADSAPEPPDKLNLNYVNLHGLAASNLVAWTPLDFFTNAANRMLADATLSPNIRLSCTNIPLWPVTNNWYSPAVHRLLQLAANLYDAADTNLFPSLFRPVFTVSNQTVRISGYRYDTNTTFYTYAKRWTDLPTLASLPNGEYADILVSGVPVVVGAKKGFPNFNEFALQSLLTVERKLELVKDRTTRQLAATNQMYIIGVSNLVGVEAWNSYATPYPRQLQMGVVLDITTVLSNEVGVLWTNTRTIIPPATNIAANTWQGYYRGGIEAPSFVIPVSQGLGCGLVPPRFIGDGKTNTAIYWQGATGGGGLTNLNAGFQSSTVYGFPVPQLGLLTSARLRYFLIDTSVQPARLVDIVTLDNLTQTIPVGPLLGVNDTEASCCDAVWTTNFVGRSRVPNGIIQQIEVSLGNCTSPANCWSDYTDGSVNLNDKNRAIDYFRAFMGLSPVTYQDLDPETILSLTNQAPFSPVRRFSVHTSWQANDPIVHYTAGDLTDLLKTNTVVRLHPPNLLRPDTLLPNIGRVNTRYRPWGGNPNQDAASDFDSFNLTLKDPSVTGSPDWDFPNNRFPNLGWIGRVHRGTPWQTVYLKSADTADFLKPGDNQLATWQRWSGDPVPADAYRMKPTNDWALLELFTTALNDNATRGQLSINQTELAAWSAVLSAVFVLTNHYDDATLAANPSLLPLFDPAEIRPVGTDGTNSALWRIWTGINRERLRRNAAGLLIHPNATFWRLGDILAVPELTVASPFLRLTPIQRNFGLTDAAYERIPQQILSLLRGDDKPRFVVYAYGQALKPAPGSIINSGPFFGLCTNYQIMAETATRTVLRIENAPTPWAPNGNPQPVVESFNLLPPD